MGKKNNQVMIYLLAVIVAIMLRSYVVDRENPERTMPYYSVPITILNEEDLTESDLFIAEQNQKTATVRVSGRLRDFNGFDAKDLRVTVDVGPCAEGEVNLPLNVSIPDNPEGLRVVNYEPTSLHLVIEQNISRTRPIVVEPTGKLPDGLSLVSLKAEQDMAIVEGSRSVVNQVTSITAQINLEEWDEGDVMDATLTPVDEKGNVVQHVTLEMETVPIHVVIRDIIELPVELKTVGQLKPELIMSHIAINPQQVQVTNVSAQALPPNLTTEPLNLDDLSKNGTQNLALLFPEGVKPVDGNQTSVTVEYTIDKQRSLHRDIDINNVAIIGASAYEVVWDTPQNVVSLDITGSPNDLDQLDMDQLQLLIYIEPHVGRQELPISVEGLPQGIHYTLEPSSLTVMVNEN